MKFDSVTLNGDELIKELNKLRGKSVNLSFGRVGGLVINGVLEEKEQKIDRLYSYKINDATLNIYAEGEYEFRLDDSYACVGFSCFVFIKEV